MYFNTSAWTHHSLTPIPQHAAGLATKLLGNTGLHGTLYAAYRNTDKDKTYFDEFIAIAARQNQDWYQAVV